MAKKQGFIFILFCAFTLRVEAQNNTFNRAYDDYQEWESAINAIELKDSTILVTSQTENALASDSTRNRRLYFSIIDNRGNLLKKNVLSFSNQAFQVSLDMRQENDEYFTVTSFSDLDSSIVSGQNYGKYVRLKSNGDTVRTINLKYHYLPNGKPGFSVPRRISDGSFINVASYNNTFGDSIYIFWNDSLGNIIRIKEYPQLHMLISSIIETPDRGFILSGFQYMDERYKTNPDFEQIFIGHPERLWYAKIDSIGNLLWQKLLTGNGYELYDTIHFKYKVCNQTRFQSAIKMQDGSYVLAGFIENNAYLRKINDSGDKIWEYKYFTKLNYLDSLRRRAIIIDIKEYRNNILVLGVIDSLKANASSTSKFTFLAKLTSTGKVLWVRYFETGNRGIIYKVFPLIEGMLLTGTILDTIPKYGAQDMWLMRLDNNGCLAPNCHLNDVVDTLNSGVPFVDRKGNETIIYPNPANAFFTIECQLADFSCSIYDLWGREVYSNRHCNGREEIYISSDAFQEGVFTIRIKDNDSFYTLNKKVLIKH